MFICALSGVDGSGKSTLAANLEVAVADRRPDLVVGQLWLRYTPPRRKPGVGSTVSARHTGHPAKRALKRVGLSGSWVIANCAVYRQQLHWQLEAAAGLDVLIADRFVVDFLADQIGAGMLSVARAPWAARRLPGWDIACVADTDDDELERRQKPGDDLGLLVRRAELYRDLARALGIRLLDGRRPHEVAALADEIVRRA